MMCSVSYYYITLVSQITSKAMMLVWYIFFSGKESSIEKVRNQAVRENQGVAPDMAGNLHAQIHRDEKNSILHNHAWAGYKVTLDEI